MSASLPVHKTFDSWLIPNPPPNVLVKIRAALCAIAASLLICVRSPKRQATGGGKTEDHRALVSALDKAAKRGVIHKNVANRRKARLNKAAAKSVRPASSYSARS